MARKTEEQTEQDAPQLGTGRFLGPGQPREFNRRYTENGGLGLLILNASVPDNAHTDHSAQTTNLMARSYSSTQQNGVTQAGTSIDFNIDRGHWISNSSATMVGIGSDFHEIIHTPTTGNPQLSGHHYNFLWPERRPVGIAKPSEYLKFGIDYTAEFDGILMGHISGMELNQGTGYLLYKEYFDNIAKDVSGASINFNLEKAVNIFEGTVTVPVKRGTRYRVDLCTFERPTGQAFQTQLTFVPINPDVFRFGDIQTPEPDTLVTASTDGLLLASASVQSVGDRGWQKIYTGYSNQTKQEILERGLMASASVHVWPGENAYIPYASALVPVPREHKYYIEDRVTSESPKFSYRWIPLIDPA